MAETAPQPKPPPRISDAIIRWVQENQAALDGWKGTGTLPIRVAFNMERGDVKVQLGA